MHNGLDSMSKSTGQLRRCDFFEPAMRDYLSEKVRKQNEQNVATHTDWDLQLCPLDSSCLVSLILDAALGLCVGNFYPCFGSAAQRMSGAQLRDAKCLPSWGAPRLSHTPTHICCSKCVSIIVESFSSQQVHHCSVNL